MSSPAKRFSVGKYKGQLISSAPTDYLRWWVEQEDTDKGARGRIHIRAGCLVELAKRGITITNPTHLTKRAMKIANPTESSPCES